MFFNILGILGFGFGYYNSKFNPYANCKRRGSIKAKLPLGGTVLGILSVFLVLIFFRVELLSSNSYEGNYTTIYESPVYALLIRYFLFFLGISSAFYFYKYNKINSRSLILIVFGVAFGFYTSSKSQVLIVALAFLSYIIIRPPKKIGRFIVSIIGLFFLLAVINVSFGYYRYAKNTKLDLASLSQNSIDILKNNGVFKSTDARGPMIVLNKELKDKNSDLKFGESYVQIFMLIIPKSFWPNRPYDLAEDFARKNMDNWSSGQGVGYSFLVEGYVNFGVLGVFIHFVLFGLLWGYAWLGIKKLIIKITTTEYWLSFYFIIGTYILFLVHRNTFSGSIKTLLFYTLPFLVLIYFFKKKKKRNENSLGT